jgi:hypothetical protein
VALGFTLAGCDACGNFPWEYPAKSCRAGPPAQ